MNAQLRNEMNNAYYRLEQKQREIVQALSCRLFELESRWYNGHYHKDDSNKWIRESYPIPVISVKSLCDIEIGFDKISISSKLERNTVLTYSFEKFTGVEFEAFGVEDYLTDFYQPGGTLQDMKENIRSCNEREIAFSFVFPFGIGGAQIFEFVKLILREGFFY